ncbi:MAG: class I SAM-dependent methyltransferase, partial [Mariniblastus sp.]
QQVSMNLKILWLLPTCLSHQMKALVMDPQSPTCPLCIESTFLKRFTKKHRDFYRCQSCELELIWPLPTLTELEDYYDNSFVDGMYQDFAAADEMKQMTARQRLKEICKSVPVEGTWLDVGCANGVFVENAIEQGVDAEGVELSQHAVNLGRDKGLPLYIGTVDDIPGDRKYDCITAFDVLEHVLDPNEFLEGIRGRLNEGGHVVLTVPNAGGIVRRLMGKRWYFYIPEEHLHYFNRKNLSALLEKHGFSVDGVGATYKPMTYDYALTQFQEFNPMIYRILKTLSFVVPKKLRSMPVPLPIGELRIVGELAPGQERIGDSEPLEQVASRTTVG